MQNKNYLMINKAKNPLLQNSIFDCNTYEQKLLGILLPYLAMAWEHVG